MKKILLLLLLTVPAMAQHNFKTEKGCIVWERFYSSSNADIKALVASNDKLTLTSADTNVFLGVGESVPNTCGTGSALMKCDTNFNFTIMAVTDGYMVKVTNFFFLEKYGPMQMRTVPNSLAKYYLEYGKIRSSEKTQTDLACVDSFLTSVFSNGVLQPEGTALTSN
jgi:hypothetical protein